ncbi:hypothetical protein ACVJBD_007212 [Rhizobium mongolense]
MDENIRSAILGRNEAKSLVFIKKFHGTYRSTVAWIRLWTRQPYPLHFSCNALELGPAKFCHPVKNTDTNLCFGLLIVKMSRFEFGPDHSLPSTHLGLSATALVVAGGFLPCHPPFGLDFCNMAIADRWNQHRLRAGNGSLGRWDNDLHDLTKACRQKISGWRSIIGRRRQ